MTKKSDKSLAREAIRERFMENPNMPRDEMRTIVRNYLPMPDVKELMDYYVNRQTSYLAGTIKDNYGRRSVYHSNISGIPSFTNIDTTDNPEDVIKIKKDLEKKAQGYAQSLEKVDSVIEQLSFNFEKDDKEDEKTKCK